MHKQEKHQSQEAAKNYRESNKKVRRVMREAKEKWINEQCEKIENCTSHNNSKKCVQDFEAADTETKQT